MRYQCVHPSVKISNATSESAIWRKFLWLAYIERPYGPSEEFSWECLPPIASNLLRYLVFTQIRSLRPWKVWICTARWFLVSLRKFKGKKSQANCCGQSEKFAANEWSSFRSLQKVSVATIQWENILETVNSETTNWYTRSYNGAFSLSFIGTIMNSWSVERLCLPCDMLGDVL